MESKATWVYINKKNTISAELILNEKHIVSQKGSATMMLSLENKIFLREHQVKMLGEV